MAEAMRASVAELLHGIDRYNPENLATLERYVDLQCKENTYDLEANLAVLKLYVTLNKQTNKQTNCSTLPYIPTWLSSNCTLPKTNKQTNKRTVVRYLIYQPGCPQTVRYLKQTNKQTNELYPQTQEEEMITRVTFLADLLETCQFKNFWKEIALTPEVIEGVSGFEDSVRKFICHVVSITYQRIDKQTLLELLGDIDDQQLKQWMNKYGWRDDSEGFVFLANQEENVKTKNIVEKIDFESVAGIMAAAIQR
ncbi:eukaryotic translation initiation factor 3 subunit K-like [Branchiostoma floridae]|uniref:Eukaryotic translation initiation factor 3 subunit K n=1 Tax=Branchiostoma floridae TaxID=7739 RepID=A0A9J7LR85_BRAFL|nr:eukaryotic translation initiation factor 3 subunit K-like [Branchiostoma floridae]